MYIGSMSDLFQAQYDIKAKLPRRSHKRKYDVDGKTWQKYSISVWNDIKKSSKERRLKHPAIFPAELPGRLIEVLSFDDDIVLDPFVGTGSTMVAARERGRSSVGFDISEKFIQITKHRLSEVSFQGDDPPYQLFLDTAENLKKYMASETIGLCVTSPPYWDILNQKRTADYKEIQNYGGLSEDLGEIHIYEDFIGALKRIFADIYNILKPEKYCCIVLMDIRKKEKYYPFHVDTIKFMEEIGFMLDDIIIWDRRSEYNNLRPLGHPYVFRVNKIHEFILIFKKCR